MSSAELKFGRTLRTVIIQPPRQELRQLASNLFPDDVVPMVAGMFTSDFGGPGCGSELWLGNH
jgi:hypothetical protein